MWVMIPCRSRSFSTHRVVSGIKHGNCSVCGIPLELDLSRTDYGKHLRPIEVKLELGERMISAGLATRMIWNQ